MKQEQFYEAVLQRLNVLIALELDTPASEKTASIAGKVHRLSGLGLSPGEIAGIIGKPSNYVTAILATRKARQRGR